MKTRGHQYTRYSTYVSTYSVQCSDKTHFLQLRITCGVAKSYPGTHIALQASMDIKQVEEE